MKTLFCFPGLATRAARSFRAFSLGLFAVAAGWLHAYDYTIPIGQNTVDGDALGFQPGWVIGIAAGTRSNLTLKNVHGTATQPIKFVNAGGRVRVGNSSASQAVHLSNCSNIEFRGDGDPTIHYGIELFAAQGQNLEADDLSTDYEICFVEAYGAGFAGFMCKTDPRPDGSSNRGNFYQYNTRIHDNYVHNVGGEGFYIGNSFYAAGTENGYPHDIIGLRVYNNICEDIGREGIQVGSASSDCEIYNNRIIRAGTLDIQNQRNGMQLGEGTSAKCYGNIIINAKGNGLILLGPGNTLVYNNVIVDAVANGIFCDNRPPAQILGSYNKIYNNTILRPGNSALLMFNEVTVNEFRNNIAVVPNTAFNMVDVDTGVSVTSSNNVFQRSTSGLNFKDELNFDFRLTSSSTPALDVGTSLSTDVPTDLEGLPRPSGSAYDAGAYEYGPLSVALLYTYPTTYGATNGSITVNAAGGTAPYTYTWADSTSTAFSRSGLASGYYTVTVTDAASVQRVRSVFLAQPPSMKVSVRALPSLAGANDGSVALTISGGIAPYTTTWSNSATTTTISSLAPGFYTYTVHDAGSTVITGTAFVADGGTPIYRVNNGGIAQTDRVVNWLKDKQTDASTYLTNTTSKTKGSDTSWSGLNLTDAPNLVISNYRYSTTSASDMHWAFPVTSGRYYNVELLFNELDSTISEGERVFNVGVEGQPMLTSFDIFAKSGYNSPSQKHYLYKAADTTLNVDFARVVGDPMMNGIAVFDYGTTMPEGIPLYRVNCGGLQETGTGGVNWLKDKQSDACIYLDSVGQLTTGSNTWSSGGTNTTDAPDNVFANYRYDQAGGMQMSYAFPVEPGVYRLNLYFIERDTAVTTGTRVFDINVEGALTWDNYDIYAQQGGYLKPGKVSVLVPVTDGELNVDFLNVSTTKLACVSGISVHRVR